MNLIEVQDNLKMLSNAQLKQVMQSGSAPAFMVVGEFDRRNKMSQSMGVPSSDMPTASVADDIMGGKAVDTNPDIAINMPAPQMAQGIGGLTPQAPPQAPATGGAAAIQATPQMPQFAEGGVVSYDEGGPVGNPSQMPPQMQDFMGGIMSMMSGGPGGQQHPGWGGGGGSWGSGPGGWRSSVDSWRNQMTDWRDQMRNNIHSFRSGFSGAPGATPGAAPGTAPAGPGTGFGGGTGSGFAAPSWASMIRPQAPAPAGAPAPAQAPAYAGGGIIDLLSSVSPLAGLLSGKGMMGDVMYNPMSATSMLGIKRPGQDSGNGQHDHEEEDKFAGGGRIEGSAADFAIRKMIGDLHRPDDNTPINPGHPEDSLATMLGRWKTGVGTEVPPLAGIPADHKPPVPATPPIAPGAKVTPASAKDAAKPAKSTSDSDSSSFASTLSDVKKAMSAENASGDQSLADLKGIEDHMGADLATAKEENSGLTLAQLGFGLAAGQSPYFATNLGEAGKDAVTRAAQNKRDERGMQKDIYEAQGNRIAARQALAEGKTKQAAQLLDLNYKLRALAQRNTMTPGQALTARVQLLSNTLRNLPDPQPGMDDPYKGFRDSLLQEVRSSLAQLNGGNISMESIDSQLNSMGD